MPLIADSSLPAFDTMRAEGRMVIAAADADRSLPDLKVGFLNLMPDAALRATDRQFMRLVSSYESSANIWFAPFAVAAEHRNDAARQHIGDHYRRFGDLVDTGVDALIVTGANPAHHDLEDEAFWKPLTSVLDWADASVESTLCSCLATHAVLKHHGMTERSKLPQKRWGVYSHDLLQPGHPLLQDLPAPVPAPHSHWFDVTQNEMESDGLVVMAVSAEAGVHMALSDEDFRYVFFQGHPEYDGISLLKEYRREVGRFVNGERESYPPFPEHYFDDQAVQLLEGSRHRLLQALDSGAEPETFPEEAVTAGRTSTWTGAGQIIYRNWMRLVTERRQ